MRKTLIRLLSMMMTAMLLTGALPVDALAASQVVSNTVNIDVGTQPTDAAAAQTVLVRFLGFDGAELKTVTVAKGGSLAATEWPDATREGYAFLGWDDGRQTVTLLEDLQQDVTLTARYVQLFTITYENWDGTFLAKVPNVRSGTSFVAADHYNGTVQNPDREGYGFDAWEPAVIESVSADTTITATFAPLVQHTITINYIYENQRQAHDPYVATVYDGYHFSETIPSPAVLGYTPDQASVSITDEIRSDINILVTYSSRLDTQYKIVHLLQNVSGDGYTVDNAATVTRTGRTGSLTAVANTDVRTYTGFTAVTNIATCNDYIAADGSTVIEIKYNRDIHYVMFDTADGTYIPPQVGRFEQPVTAVAAPVRLGYTFVRWTPTVPTKIAASDVTSVAQWTAQTVKYTIVYWLENPNDSNYSFVDSKSMTAAAGASLSTLASAYSGTLANYANFERCDTVTVKGDGTTVQNAYYKRKVYTLSFKLGDNSATLRANGTTYRGNATFPGAGSGINYQFTAKLDQSISALWPESVTPSDFNGWSGTAGRATYVSKRLTLVPELLNSNYTAGDTFTANFDGAVTDTLVYMLETADGTGTPYAADGTTRYYRAADNLAQVVSTSSSSSSWSAKDITGFTNVDIVTVDTKTSGKKVTARTVTFYYARNKATLSFLNDGVLNAVGGIYFEAALAAYNYLPARPAGMDPEYVFTGWYTDSHFYANALFGWATATMPANGLMLYAGWKKPTYAVLFDSNYEGGGIVSSQTIEKGSTAAAVAKPTRDGYQFDYWYYEENGMQKLYTFSMAITKALSLKAHWTAVDVVYTVRYVDAGGNAVLGADFKTLATKTGQNKVGALITETAPAAFNSSKQPLFPDRVSSSITLQPSATANVITFVYSRVPTVYYRVRFVDTDGVEKAPAQGPFDTSDATVTAKYVNVNGYSPNAYQITMNLAAETDPSNISQNVITFVYTKNPTGKYIVKRYLQNLDDNAYVCDEGATETYTNAPLGSTVRAADKAYEGYTFMAGISTAAGVVYSSATSPLTLMVYYNRNTVAYGASFVDADTGETIAPDMTGRARFGKTVTVFAAAVAGYQLSDASHASVAIPIASDAGRNHVTFYYRVRSDIAVNIRFRDERGNDIATPIVRTGSTDTKVRLGKEYTYALPADDTKREHNGETFTLLTGSPTTQSLTIAQGDNYIDYVYAANTYTLTFEGNNGGAGSGIAPQEHRFKDEVALPAQQPAYGTYRFEGWSVSTAVLGQVYRTQVDLGRVQLVSNPFTMPKEDLTLYAVWSYMEVTLAYASDAPFSGSLPTGATVPVGGSITVAGAGNMSRPGYTFAGWKRKNELDQLVNPPYGPDAAWEHSLSITENTVLYASWSPVRYSIGYASNLPATAAARMINPNMASGYTVESAPFTLSGAACEGYTFLGWYTDAGLGTPVTTPAIPTGSTGSRMFYARFAPTTVDGLSLSSYSGVYDGQPHGVTLTDSKNQLLLGVGVDTLTYSTPNAYVDATEGAVPVTVTVRRDGLVVWTGTATVAISRKPIALAAESISVVYDGEAHSLDVSVPTGINGAVNDADAQAIRSSLTYVMGGSATGNRFVDAMPETLVAVSGEHPNYIIASAYPTVAIARRPVTITASSLTATYDAQPHSVTTWTVAPPAAGTGLVGDDAVGTVTLSDNVRTDVGESQPMPSGATLATGDVENYSFQYNSGLLKVTQSSALTVSLSAGAGAYVFDGAAHGFAASAAGVPVTLEYRVGGGDWQTLAEGAALPAYTDVGVYTLRVRASNPNYANKPTAEATLTITRRDVTLRAGSLSAPYTGLAYTVTGWSVDSTTATTGLVGADAIQSVTLTDNARTLPGSNEVGIAAAAWATGTNPANYRVTAVKGSIEVTQNTGALAIAADGLTVTYDAQGHRLAYTVTAPEGTPYTVYYRTSDGDWIKLPQGGQLPEQIDAGVYAFDVKVESPYYAGVAEASAILTINRRPVTLVAGQSYGNVYTGSAYTVGYTVADATEATGLADGDRATAELNSAAQTDAGMYAVTFATEATRIRRGSANVTANYIVTYQSGALEIVKAESATADVSAAHIYDAQPHGYALPALQSADGEALSGANIAWSDTPLAADAEGWQTGALPTETAVKAIGAGGVPDAYTLYVRLTHPNYRTQIARTSLTIEPAPVTLTADSRDDFPYTLLADGTAKVWSVTGAHWQLGDLAQDTLYAGDGFDFALASNTQANVDEGHAVTFERFAIANADHAKNYRITAVEGFIRVVRGTAVAAMTAEGFTEVYDAQAHALPLPTVTVSAEGGAPVERTGDYTFTYAVTSRGDTATYEAPPAFTEAGTYRVRITAKSALHAAPAPVTVEVTIRQRPLTLGSQAVSYAYDGAAHSATILTEASGYAPETDHVVDATALTIGGENTATLAGTYGFAIDAGSVRVLGAAGDLTDNYAITVLPGQLTITPTAVTAAQIAMADVSAVYDGQPHSLALPQSLSLGGQTIDLTDTDRFTYSFTALDTLAAGAPETAEAGNPAYVNASTHRVTLQMTDATGSLVFMPVSANVTVTKRDVTITPESGTFVYDGAPHSVTGHDNPKADGTGVTGFIGEDYAVLALTDGTRTAAGSNAIGWVYPAALAHGDLNNYNLIIGTGTITVTQAAELTLALTPDSGVYDARSHGFAYTTGEPDAGALRLAYSTDGANWTAFETEADLPAYVDAGTYPLYLRAESDNFVASAQTMETLVISRRPVDVTPTSAAFVYDGAEKAITAFTAERASVDVLGNPTGDRGLVGADDVTVAFVNNGRVEVGESTVGSADATPVGTTNLNNYAFAYRSGTLAVTPRGGLSITLAADSATYDGQSHGFSMTTNAVGASTFEYSVDGGAYIPFTAADELPALINAGAMPLAVRVTNANYEGGSAEAHATLVVTPAPLTLRVNSASFAFDGQPHSLTATPEGLAGGDTLDAYTLSPASGTEAGIHSVAIVAGSVVIGNVERAGNLAANYSITREPGSLTIADFSLRGYEGVFDGAAHGATLAVPDAFIALYDVAYTVDGAPQAEATAFVDAGEHAVTATLTPKNEASGLPALQKTVAVTITEKPVTLLATPIAKGFNGEASSIDVSLPGGAAVNAADAERILAAITYTIDGAPVANSFTDAGAWTVTVGSACPNYTITPAPVEVAIARRSVTVTAGTATKLYDEQPLTVGYTVEPAAYAGDAVSGMSGLLRQHTLTAALVDASRIDVCDALPVTFDEAATTIVGDGGSVLQNYDVRYAAGAITITRATGLTLNLAGYSAVYDAQPHSVTVASVLDGARSVSPDRFSWLYGTAEDSVSSPTYAATNVSDALVYVRGVSVDGNYPDVSGVARLRITQRPARITPATERYVYDGTLRTVADYAVERAALSPSGQPTDDRGLLGGDSLQVTLTNNSHAEPGYYPIGWEAPVMSVGQLGNYSLESGDGSLTIDPGVAGLSIALYDDALVYDAQAHRLQYELNAPAGAPYTVEYSTDNGLTYTALDAGGQLPAATDAGQYTFKVRVTSPYFVQGYEAAAQGMLTILARPLSIASETAAFVYNGAEHRVSGAYSVTPTTAVAGLVNGSGAAHTIASFAFEVGLGNAQTAVGGHDVRVDAATLVIRDQLGTNVTANYDVSIENGRIDVTAQGTSMAPTTRTVQYNGQAQAFAEPVLLNAAGQPVEEPVTYHYSVNGGAFSNAPVTYTDAQDGGYTVTIRAESPNYQPAETTATLTITPAPITVTADSKDDFVYTIGADGTALPWTVSTASLTAGELYLGGTLAYTLGSNTRSDIGEQDVTVEACSVMLGGVDVSRNYAITLSNGHMTVGQGTAPAVMTAQSTGGEYNGTDYTLPQPVVSVMADDGTYVDQTGDYRLRYRVTREGTDDTWSLTNELPHFTDAGVYNVEITATSRRHASPVTGMATLTITRRPLTVTSGNNAPAPFTYSGEPQQVDPWLVERGTFAPNDDITSYVIADGAGNESTDVCDRPVTLDAVTLQNGSRDVTANYDITLTPGRIVIAPLYVAGGLTLTGVSHVYNGGNHSAVLSDTLVTPLGGLSLSGETLPDGSPRFAIAYTATPYGGSEGARENVSPAFTDVTQQTVTAYVTDRSGNLTIAPASETVEITRREVTITPDSLTVPFDGTGHTVTGYARPKATLDANGIAIGDTGFVGTDDAFVTLMGNGPHTLPGEYPVAWGEPVGMLSGNAGNYTLVNAEGLMTITQATGIDLSLSPDSATYDGKPHGYTAVALVPEGSAYDLAYLDGAGAWVTVTDETPLPTYVDAGTYPLTVRITSPNYTDFMVRSATLTIAQRPLTVASGNNSALPYTYDRTARQVEAAYVSEGILAEGDRLDSGNAVFTSGFANENTDVCNRAVQLAGIPMLGPDGRDVTANYALTFAAGRIVILPGEALAAPAVDAAGYDGQPHAFAAPVMTDREGNAIEGLRYAYSLNALDADDPDWITAESMPTRTDVLRDTAGNTVGHVLYVRVSQSNYRPVVTTSTLTILPAPVTMTADSNDGFVYTLAADGSPVTWSVKTATLTGTLYNAEAPVYTLRDNTQATIGGHPVQVDSVRLMFGDTDYTSNYQITREPGHIAVGRGTAATLIVAEGESTVYDAQAHRIPAPDVLVTAEDGSAVIRTDDFTFSYTATRTDTGEQWTFSDLADMAFTEAGTYSVVIHAESALHANPADETVTLTIARRPLTVTSESNAAASGGTPFTYSGKAQGVRGDMSVVNLLEGHALTDLTYVAGLENTNVDVCDRDVLLESVRVVRGGTDVTANYQIAYRPGHIVIEPFAIGSAQVELTGVETVYDGEGHSIGLPETIRTDVGDIGLNDEFDIAYEDTGSAASTEPQTENPLFYDVGEHPVTVLLTSRSGNYTVEPASASVVITPRALNVTYGTLSEAYNGQTHTVPREIEGLTDRDAISLTEQNRTTVNVTRLPDGTPGALAATATAWALTDAADSTIDRAGNYTVAVTPGTVEVTPIPLQITVDSQTFAYDASLHAVTDVRSEGLLTGHTLHATLAGNSAVNVVAEQPMALTGATVTDDATGEDVTGNYTVASTIGTLTVTPAPLTLAVTTLGVTYDGLDHQPDVYASEGLMGADTLEGYALLDMPQRAVGRYTDVGLDLAQLLLVNAAGENVTGNYTVAVQKGELEIYAPTAAYSVRYYYDNVLAARATVTLRGVLDSTVTTYPPRLLGGYALSRVVGLPLVLGKDEAENVIRVYYRSVPTLVTLEDLGIPLGAGGYNFEVGLTVE